MIAMESLRGRFSSWSAVACGLWHECACVRCVCFCTMLSFKTACVSGQPLSHAWSHTRCPCPQISLYQTYMAACAELPA